MAINVHKNCNKLVAPFRLMLNGPSESGKSELIINILRHSETLLDKPMDHIILSIPSGTHHLYAPFAARIGQFHSSVEVINGFKTLYEKVPHNSRCLVICEDQGEAIASSSSFLDLMVMQRWGTGF